MSGVPPAVSDPCRAACTGGPCAESGGHRSIMPWKSKRPVRRAFAPRRAELVGASRRRGSFQQLRIPPGPFALAVRARNWVAIEVSGHRSPNGVHFASFVFAWEVATTFLPPPPVLGGAMSSENGGGERRRPLWRAPSSSPLTRLSPGFRLMILAHCLNRRWTWCGPMAGLHSPAVMPNLGLRTRRRA